MQDLLPFIIIGLTSGSIYALSGIGLVLTYKTSQIFNFGHGALAALAAMMFYFFDRQHGVPWPIALILCCVVIAPLLGLLLEVLARALTPAATTIKVVATIGIILTVLSIGVLWFPGTTRQFPNFLPTKTFSVDGVFISYGQVIIAGFALVVTLVLSTFLRINKLGIAMRAVVDDPDLLSRTGISPNAVRRCAWMIGTSLAAASGIAIAPSLDLDATALTMLVAQAFGAAAIGTFTSLPRTYVGGLIIGVAASVSTKYTSDYSWLNGASSGLPFIILFFVLILTPRARLLVRSAKPVIEVHHSWFAPAPVRLVAGAIALVVLIFVPGFSGVHLTSYSEALIFMIVLMSLGLLVKTSGQVSLCHLTFAGIGAATFAHLLSWGVPWFVGLVLAALIAVPVGALVAIPAIRLSGVFLALATFGFAVLVEQVFYPTNLLFTSSSSGLTARRPNGGIGGWHFSDDKGYYYLILVVAVAVALFVVVLHRGRLGRLLRAMSDSSTALETGGTTINATKVLVFCISAGLAGLAGALSAPLLGFAVSSQYTSFSSLNLFAALIILVIGEPWDALIAAAALNLVPSYISGGNTSTYLQLVFGISAILYVYTVRRAPGVPKVVRDFLNRIGRRSAPKELTPQTPDSANQLAFPSFWDSSNSADGGGLEADGLRIQYGGSVAVDNVSFVAPLGSITGLIGPNGAGKTSTFNVCSGLITAAKGSVRFDGRVISRLRPHARARLGVGRTFQKIEIFESLTVRENVQMGFESRHAGWNPLNHLFESRKVRTARLETANWVLRATGLEELAETQSGLLSTGHRRLIELARALAGGFNFILLDEPSSGLDNIETRRFGEILMQLATDRNIGLLLVEHDMTLVRAICSKVYVLDFGHLVFEGTPAEMATSQIVRDAYLGSDYEPASI